MPTLTPSSEDVRMYETTLLYPYPIGQKEEKLLLDEVAKVFEEAGATLVESDSWGRRGLAYTINGYNEGNFIVFYHEMDPSKVREVEEALGILSGVLRHIMVKPPKGYEVIKFSESYNTWLAARESQSDIREREKEENIKKKVVERAKRQAKRVQEKKDEVKKDVATPKLEGDKLTEQLDKIISDDELDL
jgi:small subunit ribosomal protein S6